MKTNEKKNDKTFRKIAIVAVLLLLLVPTTVGVISNKNNAIQTETKPSITQNESINDDSVALSSPEKENTDLPDDTSSNVIPTISFSVGTTENPTTKTEIEAENKTSTNLVSVPMLSTEKTVETVKKDESKEVTDTKDSNKTETIIDEEIPLVPSTSIAELSENLKKAKLAEEEALKSLNTATENLSKATGELKDLKSERKEAVTALNSSREALDTSKEALNEATNNKTQKKASLEEARKAYKFAKEELSKANSNAESAKTDYKAKKDEVRIYEALKVLEKGITESKLNEVSMALKGTTFFEWCNSLNSTGRNFAPSLNEYLDKSAVLKTDDKYTYRITKCKGISESGYNIFLILEDVNEKNFKDNLVSVVKYNTASKTYMKGNTVVAKDNDNNKVIDGELCSKNAVDITDEVNGKFESVKISHQNLKKANKAAKSLRLSRNQAKTELKEARSAFKDTAKDKSIAKNSKKETSEQVSQNRKTKVSSVKAVKNAKAEIEDLESAVTEAKSVYDEAVENTANAQAELDKTTL